MTQDWKLDMDLGPIYRQIVRHVQQAIARGDLNPGDRLPSARALAQQLRVNPNTIIHAYSQLEREGLVETKRGLGTFIRSDVTPAASRHELLSAAARRYAQEARALGVGRAEAVRAVQEVFDDRSDA